MHIYPKNLLRVFTAALFIREKVNLFLKFCSFECVEFIYILPMCQRERASCFRHTMSLDTHKNSRR